MKGFSKMKLQWNGNLDDDCSSKTNDGYFAHVECMGSNTCQAIELEDTS
jgi:hypothetical protein